MSLLLVLALARGLLLAGTVPPMHGPDESAHFDYVQRVGEHRSLPRTQLQACVRFSEENRRAEALLVDPIRFRPDRPLPPLSAFLESEREDPAARATTGCGPAGAYPPVYYATAALGYAVADEGLLSRLFWSRAVSVCWGALGVVFAFLCGLWLFGRTSDGLLLGTLFVVQPMYWFLTSVVTNDAALFACSTGAFAAAAALCRFERQLPSLVLLAACTTLGVMSKPTLTFLLPVVALAVVAAMGPRKLRSWVAAACALLPAAIAFAAWTLGPGGALATEFTQPRSHLDAVEFARTFLNPDRLYVVWWKFYWMGWGWLDTVLSSRFYLAILASVAVAAFGVLARWRSLPPEERGVVALAVGGSAYALVVFHVLEISVIRSTGMAFVQGRYMLPLYALHAAAIVVGLRAFTRLAGARVDGAWAFAALLAVVDLGAFARLLSRYYS